jgi:glycopeptide antibiotics resistance protein
MRKRWITAVVLAVYFAVLIRVVVFKSLTNRPPPGMPGMPGMQDAPSMPRVQMRLPTSDSGNVNLVPFKTILPQLRGRPSWASAIVNLVGNTVLFVPVGFLAPMAFRKMTWLKALALAVAVGLTMEAMEGIFHVGIVDIDDVILNTLGVMSGYWMYLFLNRKKQASAVQSH